MESFTIRGSWRMVPGDRPKEALYLIDKLLQSATSNVPLWTNWSLLKNWDACNTMTIFVTTKRARGLRSQLKGPIRVTTLASKMLNSNKNQVINCWAQLRYRLKLSRANKCFKLDSSSPLLLTKERTFMLQSLSLLSHVWIKIALITLAGTGCVI